MNTQVINKLISDNCKQCKFNKICENKTKNGCDDYEQSILITCEKCACKEVCYYHRDIVSGTKYEDECFGEGAKCLNYIEQLD